MTAPTNSPERRWATGVLVLSGAISLGFNTRHAFGSTSLPWPLALGYGAGPVLLAAMQSHVVALQAARGELVGGWRKATTYGLVVGALALSFLGIYDLLRGAVPNPIPVLPFNLPAILTPVVVDLMALAALHELLRPATVVASPVVSVPIIVPATAPVAAEETTVRPVAPTALATASGHLLATIGRPVFEAPGNGGRSVDGDRIGHAPQELAETAHTGSADHPTDDRPATTTTTPAKPARTTTGRPVARKRNGRPTPEDNAAAVAAYRASVAARSPLSERQLAERFGRSKGWARDRIQEAGPQLVGGHPGDHAEDQPNDQTTDDETTAEEATG